MSNYDTPLLLGLMGIGLVLVTLGIVEGIAATVLVAFLFPSAMGMTYIVLRGSRQIRDFVK